ISQRVIILGMDGMDPNLLKRFVAAGLMPNFQRFIEKWHFGNLQTTMPPQSPVAWSSFITGTNPGGHGIFDFIHRDAKTFTPYLSTSRSTEGKESIKLGNWRIPLEGGHMELLRRSRPFWSHLRELDVPSTIFQIPANFPVGDSSANAISGMG